MSQLAVFIACQSPVKSGFRSAVRGIVVDWLWPATDVIPPARIAPETAAPAARTASAIRVRILMPPSSKSLFLLLHASAAEGPRHGLVALMTGVLVDLILGLFHV